MYTERIQNTFRILVSLVIALGGTVTLISLGSNKVKAAEVRSYIDLTGDSTPNVAPATVTTPPEVATSTATNFFVSYAASTTQFAAANTITITLPAAFTTPVTCTPTPTTDADLDSTPDGSLAVNGNTFTYTFSAATTAAIANGVEICVRATTPAANGNYSISISDNNDSDNSAALIYVGTIAASDTNDVTVTATVPVVLSLSIRNPSTTAITNSCALGVLNPASTNTCAYRIAAGTNGTAGMSVHVVADALLNSGGNDINNVADGTVTTGAEEYGVTLTAGAGWTLIAPFNSGDDPITTTQQEFQDRATIVDDSNTANWTTVTHRASITSSTVTGAYDQVVTYRAYYIP